MNILIIVQIFESHSDTGSDRHFFFAKELAKKGHKVNVITSNVDYKKAERRFKKSFFYRKEIEGINVTYVPAYTKFRGSFLKRILFFVSFFIFSFFEILRLKDINLIYAVSTPLSNGFLGSIFSFIKKVPLFFEVTDVWPDAAIQTGVIKNGFIIRISKAMEQIIYKQSQKVICLTEGIKKNIQKKGVASSKIILITNGVDLKLFPNLTEKEMNIFRVKYKLEKSFNCLYIGAHGLYNSLMTILLAANEISHEQGINFILVGDGDEKLKLQDFASKNNLKNVKFFDPVKREEAIGILSTADIFLLPNRRGTFFEGNLPNKLFDYLAASRPILVSGYGESADLVLQAKAGFIVDAEDYKDFSSKILDLSKFSKTKMNIMGKNGRNFVEKNYNRIDQVEVLSNLIING